MYVHLEIEYDVFVLSCDKRHLTNFMADASVSPVTINRIYTQNVPDTHEAKDP